MIKNIKGEQFKQAYKEDPTICHLINVLLYINDIRTFEEKSNYIKDQFKLMMESHEKNYYPSYNTIGALHHTYCAVKSAKEMVLYK